jgi:hypothetical protein
VKTSKSNRTVYAKIGFSYDEDRDVVRLTMADVDPEFGIVAIHRDGTKPNGHRQLFRRLRAILDKAATND